MNEIRDEKDEIAREVFAVSLGELCPELEEPEEEDPRPTRLGNSQRITEIGISHTKLARYYAESRETSPAEVAGKKRREHQEMMEKARGVRRRKK